MSSEGSHAQRLARGATLLQGAQIIRLLAGFGVLTLLARRLSLAELGLYSLLIALGTYAQFLKSSVMNAAVVGVADALDDRDRTNVVVSTGFVIYAGIGLVAAVLLGGIGLLALPVLDVPDGLEDSARAGIVGMAVVTAIGWPVQIYDDLLRGLQRFAAVAVLEIGATVASVVGIVVLVLVDAPVWTIVTWNAAIPLLIGIACFAALPLLGIRARVRASSVRRPEARRFGSVSGMLAVGGVAGLVQDSADRFIIGAVRDAASVGLYAGVLQVQNIVRFLNGVLSQPVVPAARRFMAEGDDARVHELFVRGLRYTLAITAPLATVLCAAAGPVLVTWLGPKFADVEAETAVSVGWWIVGANTGLVGTMLTAAGKYRLLAVLAWAGVLLSTVLTLVLTGPLGLWGAVFGAVSGFALVLVYGMPASMRIVGATWGEVLRRAWLPAYSTAAVVGVLIVVIRLTTGLATGWPTVVVCAAAMAAYAGIYLTVWSDANERRLVRSVLVRRRG